jgi:hypothetical protein
MILLLHEIEQQLFLIHFSFHLNECFVFFFVSLNIEHTQDWCISRQLWWGHRIPAYRVIAGDQGNFRLPSFA